MKYIVTILILVLSFNCFGQFPNNPTQSNTSTNNQFLGAITAQKGIVAGTFTDTTQANSATYIKTVPFILISCTTPNALYFRNAAATAWVQLLPSGGGSGGQSGWLLNGNSLLPQAFGNIGLGLNVNRGINFVTNSTTRFSLDSTGILDYSSTVIPLGYDSVSKKLARASGGTVSLNLQQVTDVGNTTTNDIIFSSPYPSRNSLTWTSNGGTDYGQLIYGGNTGNYTWTLPNKTGTIALLSDITDNSWGLSGNSGTTAGTNFIGTTDNTGLMFKINGNQAGFLDVNNSNTSFGDGSLALNTSGNLNVAIGYNSQSSITTGVNNVSVGASSLQSANSSYNTAIGEGSLSIVSGNMNIGLGRYSGRYLTTESNRLIINSINRTNKGNDTTQSIIYGAQDATAANQRLYINAKPIFPYVPTGVGTKALRIDASGNVYQADTTSTGSTISGLTTNYITKAASSSTIANSLLYDDGSTVTSTGKIIAPIFKDSNTSIIPSMMYNFQGNLLKSTPTNPSSAAGGFWAYKNLTSGSWSGGTATMGVATAHNYAVGNIVKITSANPSGYNGTYIITAVPTSTTFSYALASNPGSYTSGGNATIEPQIQLQAYQLGTPAMFISANPSSVPSGIDAYPPVFMVSGDNGAQNYSWSIGVDGHSQLTYSGGYLKSFLNGMVSNATSEHTYGWTSSTTTSPLNGGSVDLNISRVRAGYLGIGTTNTSADTTGGIIATTGLFKSYIGLGTSSPTSRLHVIDNSVTTGNAVSISSSSLTTGSLMSLTNTGTAAASNTKNVLSIVSSGANATSSQTVTGQTISVTNTGTTNTNVGLNITASGASTNNALVLTGNVDAQSSVFNGRDWQGYNSGSIRSYFGGAGAVTVASGGYYAIGSSSTNAFSQDVYLNRQSAGVFGIGTSSSNTSGTIVLANIGIGTTSVAASASLDITSTTKGFLPPRMTTTQKNAISSPAEGLIVYDTTLHKLCVYTGSAWETITSL